MTFLPEYDDDEVHLPDVIEPTPLVPEQGVGPTFGAEEMGAPELPPQEEPEEITVANMYQLIPIAMQQRKHLQVTYTSVNKGTTKTYVMEPYEIKEGMLWAWDIESDRIKSLYLSNISDIQLLNTTFIPRFE